MMSDANEARLYLFFWFMLIGAGFVFSVGVGSFVGYCIKRMRGEE